MGYFNLQDLRNYVQTDAGDAFTYTCFFSNLNMDEYVASKRRCQRTKLHILETECHVHPFSAYYFVLNAQRRETLCFLVALLCRGSQLGLLLYTVALGSVRIVRSLLAPLLCAISMCLFYYCGCGVRLSLCGIASSNGPIVLPPGDI